MWQLLKRKLDTERNACDMQCPICFSEAPVREFTLLRCGHQFCTTCIERMHRSGKSTCAFCRDEIVQGGMVHARNLPECSVSEAPDPLKKFGSKLQEILKVLERIHAEEPRARVIVFTQWQSVEAKLSSALSQAGIGNHRLSMCRDIFERRRVLQSFQAEDDDQVRVLLLSLDGHASGTNLTAASHVFLVHPMLSATVEQQEAYERQAIGRAVRLGQTKKVTVWRFVAEETIEQEIFSPLLREEQEILGNA